MKCNNCGYENTPGNSFCIKCGSPLTAQTVNTVEVQTVAEQVAPVEPESRTEIMSDLTEQVRNEYSNIKPSTPVEEVVNPAPAVEPTKEYVAPSAPQVNVSSATQTVSTSKFAAIKDYFMFMLYAVIKPNSKYKEAEESFDDKKTLFTFAGITAGVIAVLNILRGLITAVFVKCSTLFCTKSLIVSFENLKNVEYLKLIFTSILMGAGIILSLAIVFYVAGLIFKKQAKFTRLLAISSVAVLPAAAVSLFVSTILGYIWAPLSMILTIASAVYSLAIFITLVNEQFEFENNDSKILFNSICFAILAIAGYYLGMHLITSAVTSSITDGLNGIMNMFN